MKSGILLPNSSATTTGIFLPKPLASFFLKFTITPAPKARGIVKVTINIIGRIMPVVDVSGRFKKPEKEIRTVHYFAITRSDHCAAETNGT